MKTPLAWHNLVHNRMRTFVATAGVAFAAVLVFMQLGFLGAVENTATLIYDKLDFDLIIRSKNYLHLSDPGTFSRQRLVQAENLPGIDRAVPFYIALNQWRNPKTGAVRGILAMGVRPEDPVFTLDEIRSKTHLLTQTRALLIDRKTHRDFGPADGERFSDRDIGLTTEVGHQGVLVVENFAMGAGLAADGAILLSDEGFCRIFPGRDVSQVSIGLVKVEPGVSPERTARLLNERLEADVEALPRRAVLSRERSRWINDTSIGVIFESGVYIALVVGVAIVYQVLSSDIADHMAEYATLKAIGYSNHYLAKIVLQQSIALAVIGFLPALAIAQGLYLITSAATNMPIYMTTARIGGVLALSVAMCSVSALGAMRKLRSAEPADLF